MNDNDEDNSSEADLFHAMPDGLSPQQQDEWLQRALVAMGVDGTVGRLGDVDEVAVEPAQRLDGISVELPELRDLRRSGIPDDVIALNNIRTENGREIVGRVCGNRSSLIDYFIKYPRVNPLDPVTVTADIAVAPVVGATYPCAMPGEIGNPYGHRIRLRHPRASKTRGFDEWARDERGHIRGSKYESPWKESAMIFFPVTSEGAALYARCQLWDATEGEKKSIVQAMCGLASIGATGIDMLLDYDHVRALALEHLKSTGGDTRSKAQLEAAKQYVKKNRPASEVWRLHPRLADLGDVCGKTLRIGFDHWLDKEPDQNGVVAEVRAAVRLAGAWYRAGGALALFVFPRALAKGELAPKGWDDLLVAAGLRARGLSSLQHDLTIDARRSIDLEAGKAAVLAQLDQAIELKRENVCGEWPSDEKKAVRSVQDQCGYNNPQGSLFRGKSSPCPVVT